MHPKTKHTQVTKEMENYMALLEKIKGMMEAKQPVRTGEWSTAEVDNINEKLKELITTKSVGWSCVCVCLCACVSVSVCVFDAVEPSENDDDGVCSHVYQTESKPHNQADDLPGEPEPGAVHQEALQVAAQDPGA